MPPYVSTQQRVVKVGLQPKVCHCRSTPVPLSASPLAPHLDDFKRNVLALPVAIQPQHQPVAGARQLLQVALDLLVLAL